MNFCYAKLSTFINTHVLHFSISVRTRCCYSNQFPYYQSYLELCSQLWLARCSHRLSQDGWAMLHPFEKSTLVGVQCLSQCYAGSITILVIPLSLL